MRFNSPFTTKFRKNPGKRDSAHHLYVNFDRGKFICYKSGMAGSLSYLLMELGEAEQDAGTDVPDWTTLKHRLESLDGHTFETPRADLPDWYSPVAFGSCVHHYLRGRGVTDEDIEYYKIGQGVGDFAEWLVVPSFDRDGECEYWVSRRITSGKGPKYKNPVVSRRYHVGFLYKAVQVSTTVVLCEGVFSSIIAGRDSIVSFGKYVTDIQLSKMRLAGVRGVVLALDGDAWRETVDTAERCYRMGFETWVLPMPFEEDPADMGREAFRTRLQTQSIPIASETAILQLAPTRFRRNL